jgi:ABC-type transport system involved in cytochrome c biogenesis permease subunit
VLAGAAAVSLVLLVLVVRERVEELEPLGVMPTLIVVAVVAVLVELLPVPTQQISLAATAVPVLSSSVLRALTHLLLVQLRSVAHQQARTQVVVPISLSTRSIRRAR